MTNGGVNDSLQSFFPHIVREQSRKTSESTPFYNCIAWAAEDTGRWWWPDFLPDGLRVYYWPDGAQSDDSVSAFIDAFSKVGYSCCADGKLEKGLQKVALYADQDEHVTHAARQLTDGMWTSKLGENIDCSHTLRALEGGIYGSVTQFLCKTRA